MVTIRREASLPASAETVWSVASPPARWEDWLSLHLRWPKPPPATIDAGSTFAEQVSLLNIPMPVTWTITEFAPARVFAMRGESLLGVTIDLTFELAEQDARTDLVLTVELGGALVMGGLRNQVEQYADGHLEQSLAKLTSLLG